MINKKAVKEFLKPDWKRILVLIILIVIIFPFTPIPLCKVFNAYEETTYISFCLVGTWLNILPAPLGLSCDCNYAFIPLILLMYYFLSCLIIFIYNRIKK